MKNIKSIKFNSSLLLVLLLIFVVGCERDINDDAPEAGFSRQGEIFTDAPIGMGEDFYFPYGDSNFEAINFNGTNTFEGDASIEINVPNADNPNGNYAGAILRIDGAGRDLTGFDALTFYARASQGVTLDAIGFGEDFIENKYQATVTNLSIGTGWNKYIIPIPDPSKLTQERGMLRYAAGTQNTGGFGYTIWLDDIKFENLGTVAQPRPKIFNGDDLTQQTFNQANLSVFGISQTFNLGNGQDQTVEAAPSYFSFNSSNPSVATVNELGVISVLSDGTSTITATIGGVEAQGSLVVNSLGDFTPAETPDEAPENVISLFSDAYTNVPVDYYNGFFNGDGQTTQGGTGPGGADVSINGNGIINYTQLNFVGIGTFLDVSPINATQMTHLHVDINVQEAIDAGDFITLQILNGVQTSNETSGSVTLNSSQLESNNWVSFDIPLGEFSGLGGRDALGLLFFISDSTISNIYVDNIYYYREVIDPSPNVDDSAATEVALPVGFESSTLTYDFFGFEGAVPAIISNPDPTGINPTTNVMESQKTAGAQFFAGNVLNLDSPIDFSSSQKFRMKVWSPKLGIPIRVRLENADNSFGIELDANTTTSNEWEELEWDFSSQNTSADFVRVVVFFEFVPGLPGDGSTYYFDDIQIID